MAGRGKVSTMPAWMAAQGAALVEDLLIIPDPHQFGIPPAPDGQAHGSGEMEREKDRDSRDTRGRDYIRDNRDSRDNRDNRDNRNNRDIRDNRDDRDNRDNRNNRDSRDNRDNRDNYRGRDRGSRDRDRDRDNDRRNRDERRDDRGRRSPSPREEWKPKPYRQTNFDVMGPGGTELPGVGVSIMLGVSYNAGVVASSCVSSSGGGGMGGHGRSTAGGGTEGQGIQQTRHARRLYVGGLPPGALEDDVTSFFVVVIQRATAPHGIPGLMGPPVVQTYINSDKCFGFVEFCSMELTASCLDLSGIKFGNSILRIRRPNDYKPELVPPSMQPLAYFNTSVLDIVNIGATQSQGGGSEPSPGRMFIGGLPYHLTEDQVKELLGAFGQLKNFNLVRDAGSITSKGYAFCEYLDSTSTNTAIAGLHNLPLGDKVLTVRLASGPNNNSGGGGGGQHGLGGGLVTSYGYGNQQAPEYMPAPPSNNWG